MDEVINIILADSVLAGFVIFISQLIFIGLRTINVMYTSDRNIKASIITGFGISMAWLISISLGINSVLTGDWFPILMFVIGGGIGTYIGFKIENKIKNRKNRKLKKIE